MIVKHGGKQVRRRTDGVHIAREVEVDILHGDDLRISAACGAALHAEHGAQRGLTQGDNHVLADTAHAVRKSDGGRRLALPCRSGRNGGDKDEFPLLARAVHDGKIDFCLVLSVVLDVVLRKPRLFGNLQNWFKLGTLCNFNIAFHAFAYSALSCASPLSYVFLFVQGDFFGPRAFVSMTNARRRLKTDFLLT